MTRRRTVNQRNRVTAWKIVENEGVGDGVAVPAPERGLGTANPFLPNRSRACRFEGSSGHAHDPETIYSAETLA